MIVRVESVVGTAVTRGRCRRLSGAASVRASCWVATGTKTTMMTRRRRRTSRHCSWAEAAVVGRHWRDWSAAGAALLGGPGCGRCHHRQRRPRYLLHYCCRYCCPPPRYFLTSTPSSRCASLRSRRLRPGRRPVARQRRRGDSCYHRLVNATGGIGACRSYP